MTTLPALSADELRVLLQLAGATALPLESHPEDVVTDVADVVAARSLLARGLAHLTGSGLRVAPGACAALAALLPADRLVQVEFEVDGDLCRHVLAEGNNQVLQLREREPDVWVCDGGELAPSTDNSDDNSAVIESVLDHAVLDLVQAHVADSSGATTDCRLELDAHTHLQTDAAAADGNIADAVQPLRLAHVDDASATRWATALVERRGAGAVRVAHRTAGIGGPTLSGQGVGWVAAGPHGLWQVMEHEDGATVTTTDADALLSQVREDLRGDVGRRP